MTRRRSNRFCLNETEGKYLGVCAGIASFLNVRPWAIRLAFIIGIFFGVWILVPAYFIAWLLMDRSKAEELKRTFNRNSAVNHLRNVDYRKRIYRNPRDGKALGVCAGLADYLETDAFWIRIITVIVMISSGFLAVFAYFAAYLLLDARPGRASKATKHPEYSQYKDTLDETRYSTRPSMKSSSRKFSALQERLRKLEAYVTSSRYRTNSAFKNM